jgi:hypothetical protein
MAAMNKCLAQSNKSRARTNGLLQWVPLLSLVRVQGGIRGARLKAPPSHPKTTVQHRTGGFYLSLTDRVRAPSVRFEARGRHRSSAPHYRGDGLSSDDQHASVERPARPRSPPPTTGGSASITGLGRGSTAARIRPHVERAGLGRHIQFL